MRPICKQNVEYFSIEEIRAAIEKTGVKSTEGCMAHRHEEANTIAITTMIGDLAERFLQIREIPKTEKGSMEV